MIVVHRIYLKIQVVVNQDLVHSLQNNKLNQYNLFHHHLNKNQDQDHKINKFNNN